MDTVIEKSKSNIVDKPTKINYNKVHIITVDLNEEPKIIIIDSLSKVLNNIKNIEISRIKGE